jgi:hypothetical protein
MSGTTSQLGEPDGSAAPSLIGERYEVLSVLGRGGMGTVFRVRDRFSGRLLALKRVSFDARVSIRSLFEREYTTLARLTHPSLLEVYDYGLEADAAYYTMELLDGDDLSRLAPLPYPRVCRHLLQVATTLTLLHARRLVHRDLSPRNVRVGPNDACKLLDFGALGAFGEQGAVIGTPPCVPPEATEHEALDERVDLYGLGCLAYYALTGRHAYPASQVAQLPSYWAQPIEAPSALVAARQANGAQLPALPAELDDLVLSLLQLDRSARPTSAGAVIEHLHAILGQSALDEFELAANHLTRAPTAGREAQLTAAQHWTDQLLRERGQVLVFEGPEGVGKTRLLQEIALAAKLRGPSVILVDASADERPYATARALCQGIFAAVPSTALDAARPHAALLGQIAPELGGPAEAAPSEAPPQDALWQNRVQLALRSFILEVSRRTPLALLVDNLHDCDHHSATLISTLAHDTKHGRLLLVAALRPDDNALAVLCCRALRAHGQVFAVDNLSAAQLASWFEALFGRHTPNLPRLCQFAYAQTAGQPSATVELLYALLRAKQLRYSGGSWVLPLAPSTSALPSSGADAVRARVEGLGSQARAVAQALCLQRGTLTRSLCHVLCELDEASLQPALKELVDARILLSQRDGYTFAHDAVRDALRAQMPVEERTRQQRRIADTILARASPQIWERLQAGLHLLEANDERAMPLLCKLGFTLSTNPESMAGCVPILERALELAKARGRSQRELATLLAPLAVAAYVVDRRLERYTNEFVACFVGLTGLSLAQRLRPLLGKHLSSYLGLGWAALRHAFTPRARRHTRFADMIEMFIGAAVTLAGKSAICLDGPGIQKLVDLLEPLTVFGKRHVTQFAHDFCQSLWLVTQDRYGETYALCVDLEQRLYSPSIVRQTQAEARRLWQGGLHYVLGLFESFASDPKVLERAVQLEKSVFSVDRMIAAQLRRLYHTFRGEADALRQANEQVEAAALQSGSSWQVETWSAIVTNYAAGLWGDLVDAKRALTETERLAIEVPTLARYAQSSRAVYCLELGRARDCVSAFEDMFKHEKPRERIGWTSSMGLCASAYNELGDHAKARQLCEEVLRDLDPRDARYAGMYLPAASALVFALASLGEHAAAERYLNEQLARYQPGQSPLVLGTLHESGARSAWLRGDRKAFTLHLKEVERYFCPLGQAALIRRFLRLTMLGGSEGEISAQIAAMREVKAFENALAALTDRDMMAHHIFAWLMQKCEGFRGYLFLKSTKGARLTAANDQREPPDAVLQLAARGLGSMSMDDVTTHCGPVELSTQGERPMSKRENEAASAEILHVHLLSFVRAERFCAEGALVLRGTHAKPPRLRYDLLQVAAKHLRRAHATATSQAVHSPPPTPDHSAAS